MAKKKQPAKKFALKKQTSKKTPAKRSVKKVSKLSKIELKKNGCTLICNICGELGSYATPAACERARKAHAGNGHKPYCDCIQHG